MPALPSDKNDPEVPDTKADDHNYDDLSYACQSRPLAPDVKKNGPGGDLEGFPEFDELDAKRIKTKTRMGFGGMW